MTLLILKLITDPFVYQRQLMYELFGTKIFHRMMSFSDPCDNRFGFRPKHSGARALIEITEKLQKEYAKK